MSGCGHGRTFDWTQKNRRPGTYRFYREHTQQLTTWLKGRNLVDIECDELTPSLFEEYLEECSPGRRHGAVQVIKRVYNWGTRRGRIKSNRMLAVEKPSTGRRRNYIVELFSFGIVAVFYMAWLTLNDATGTTSDCAASNAGIWLSLIVSVLAVRFICQIRKHQIEQHEQLVQLNEKLTAEIADRERTEEAFIRSQQLDAVGRLAAGLARELNNVLMVITGTAECIQFSPENATSSAYQIIECAQRGGRLTSGLLQFARQETRENVPFDMRKVVGQVKEIIARSHWGRIELAFNDEIAPCWVLGDAQLLSQALLNLALNGIDAMDGSGKLHLGIQHCGETVEVEVIDEGCGMNDEDLSRVVEPFFTTKPPGSGTGLGLSMAFGTVQDHGGELVLESELGVGSRAVMTLPNYSMERMDGDDQELESSFDKVTASAILVEDDAMVRKTMKACLETLASKFLKLPAGRKPSKSFSKIRVVWTWSLSICQCRKWMEARHFVGFVK